MNWSLALDFVLTIAIIVLIVFVITVLVQLTRTLSSLNQFIKDTDRGLIPALEELQLLLKRANGELGRIDEIVSSIQDISDKVQTTMRIAQDIVSSPLIKVASLSAGTREAIRKFIGRK